MPETLPETGQRPSADAVQSPIRNTVRALIVQRNHVLLLRKELADGTVCHTLPGGAQEPGEGLVETLQRECREEIGAGVEVVELLHVADLFKRRAAKRARYRHQLELVFRCRVGSDYVPRKGPKPDKFQAGVEWISLRRLHDIDLKPSGMQALIGRAALGLGPAYAGVLPV